MDDPRRGLSPGGVLALIAVALVAGVFWAASALAADGSPASERGVGDVPAAESVQSEGEAPDRDCPNDDGESESSSDV
jgi:hypothetical protein